MASRRQMNPAFFQSAQTNERSQQVSNQTLIRERVKRGRSSGTLNLKELDLTEVPEELYTITEGSALGEGEKWWHVVDIVSISLRDNKITTLSDRFEQFVEHLEVLDLTGNRIVSLPMCIFKMTQLRSLQLGRNQMSEIPDSFDPLINLQVLDLAENELTTLPNTIGRLQSLEILNVSGNKLMRLPSVLEVCSNLIKLQASNNQIESVGENVFRGMQKLDTLELDHNKLSVFPFGLEMLCSCKVLNLQYNQIQTVDCLPASLDQCLLGYNRITDLEGLRLQNLKSLSAIVLCDNKIETLPDTLLSCTNLKVLDVANNDLNSLPPGLGYLEHLNVIKLTGNPLKTIRRALVDGGAVKLKAYLRSRGAAPDVLKSSDSRYVDENQAQADAEDYVVVMAVREAVGNTVLSLVEQPNLWTNGTPKRIADLFCDDSITNSLTKVKLANNQLTYFPFAIQNVSMAWSMMQELDFSGNQLTTLPIDLIARLFPNLKLLSLSRNSLTATGLESMAPSNAVPLANLEELDLTQNALRRVPSLTQRCPKLRVLKLGQNQISQDTPQSFATCKLLMELDLSDNQLNEVPSEVMLLSSLELLNLENNNIATLNPEIALLPSIKSLLIAGNPQRVVRVGVVLKGGAAVVEYLATKVPVTQQQQHRLEHESVNIQPSGTYNNSFQPSATYNNNNNQPRFDSRPSAVYNTNTQPPFNTQPSATYNNSQPSATYNPNTQPPFNSQPSATYYNNAQPSTTHYNNNNSQPPFKTQPSDTFNNGTQPSVTYNNAQPSATHYNNNNSQPSVTYNNNAQPPFNSQPSATYNNSQPSVTYNNNAQPPFNSQSSATYNNNTHNSERRHEITGCQLSELLARISLLENELDSPSITNSRKLVARKELARVRATVNRLGKENPGMMTFG